MWIQICTFDIMVVVFGMINWNHDKTPQSKKNKVVYTYDKNVYLQRNKISNWKSLISVSTFMQLTHMHTMYVNHLQ